MAALEVGELVAYDKVELVGVETIDERFAHHDLATARRHAVGDGVVRRHDDQIDAVPVLVAADAAFDDRVTAGSPGSTSTHEERHRQPDGHGRCEPTGDGSTRLQGDNRTLARRS